jgi:acyl-CoA dehydrogenase
VASRGNFKKVNNEEAGMNLGLSEEMQEIREKIRNFVEVDVVAVETEYHDEVSVGDRWSHTPRQEEIMESLKAKARTLGLWNFFLPKSQGGAGISNLEYAHLAEIMGRSRLASEAFNCSAPDTGNMEVLERYGSEEQKEQWLKPLLAGKIRSAFAMTEPDIASSDATNISTSAVLDGNEWVINGEKFYISGAGDSRCKIMIVMVVTDPDAPKHNRQSQILVAMDTPGVEVLRPMEVFGSLMYEYPKIASFSVGVVVLRYLKVVWGRVAFITACALLALPNELLN